MTAKRERSGRPASPGGRATTSSGSTATRRRRRQPGGATSAREPDGPAVAADAVGGPAARRALRSQGRATMRRLLDAAMTAIDERGYHGTRVQDVVDIANTSHGTFYLYFSNKEDLVRALTVEAASQVTKMSRAMTEAGSSLRLESWEELRKWVAGYSALWSQYAPLFRSWTDLVAIDDGVADQIRRMVLAHRDAIAERVADVDGPPVVDPAVAGMAVIALLDRFHFLREFVGEPVDDAALDSVTTIVHRALFPAALSGERGKA
ncbi:MAG TPA: TetR/AcrR family transcriptional regulator [Acidimicrobiales bacterium]|nr:TetR/AcrR family transcriptional regulator [Acidimicrobiales bacterium]